jgi:hypothetical protein
LPRFGDAFLLPQPHGVRIEIVGLFHESGIRLPNAIHGIGMGIQCLRGGGNCGIGRPRSWRRLQ